MTGCSIHKLVADVMVLAQGRVLMVRYRDVSKYDGQRGWFLPDDNLAMGEHPGEAAKRILREQAGTQFDAPQLSFIESFGGEDGEAWHLIFHYKVQLPQASEVSSSGNVAEARWFSLEGLPPRDEVAHHGWALDVIAKVVA